MKKVIFTVLLCTTMLVAQAGRSQNAFRPDQIKWGPPPPFVNAGAQFAVLEGDPTASSGDFTIRIKMPDGYKIAPHSVNLFAPLYIFIEPDHQRPLTTESTELQRFHGGFCETSV